MNPARATVVFVLGMHRSGTSLATRQLEAAGFAVPGPVLAASADNPQGYSEPRVLVRANNRILQELGRSWFDDRPACATRQGRVFAHWRPRLKRLLRGWLRRHPKLVLKDPRLCRLFVLWHQAAQDCGADIRVLLVARSPTSIANSLARRYDNPAFRPAAIIQSDKADLLYLRYWLDAERTSRGLKRAILRYEDLIAGKDRAVRDVLGEPWPRAGSPLNRDAMVAQEASVRPPAYRPNRLVDQLIALDPQCAASQNLFDRAQDALDRATIRHAPLRATLAAPYEPDPWVAKILDATRQAFDAADLELSQVLFLSGAPKSRGHIYRVEHSARALRARGITVRIMDAPGPETIEPATDLLVLFRTVWTANLARVIEQARRRGIPVVFDIDDAVFEPALMTPAHFDYLRIKPQQREAWASAAKDYQRSLREADAALLSTEPLLRLARQYQEHVFLVPNGLDADRLGAEAAVACSDQVVIGYASGTPTHQRDFLEVVLPLVTILARYPQVRLRVIGHLDLQEYPELAPFAARIETRAIVEFEALPGALAEFDINLAPLQPSNPFCEAKSELKFFEAAVVCVPTVASATAPFGACIQQAVTGYIAQTQAQWVEYLSWLVEHPEQRRTMGRLAREHALAQFGPDARADRLLAALASIVRRSKQKPPAL